MDYHGILQVVRKVAAALLMLSALFEGWKQDYARATNALAWAILLSMN